MLGLLVVGQIVGHDLTDVEVVGKLEGQHRIVNLPFAHLLDILLRTHPICVFMVVRDTAAEHDGLQVQFLAQFLAVLVHTACQAQAAVVGMDEHLDAVKDIPFGIMRAERLVSRHFGIRMVSFHQIVIHDDGKGATDNLVIGYRHHLPFWKDA